jgi:hypothetical protein
MALKQVLEVYELMDSPQVDGDEVKRMLLDTGLGRVESQRIKGPKGYTDFIKVVIPGYKGKIKGGDAPTLGIVGRLGGIGARPERIGFVSDGDGAAVAIASALKLGRMHSLGDVLAGDVIITTHICPHAPTRPHEPVPFMDSPVDIATMNKYEVDPAMDAILSVDTTKGNRIINHRGFAISPTVKEGYILRVSEDLLDIMTVVTGKLPVVFAITLQDITPYGNDVYHVNSILQPSTATAAPCVGVAITAETAVPGCATGASHVYDIEQATRFAIEVAKAFTEGKCRLYDDEEYRRLLHLYGTLNHLQTLGLPGQKDEE